MHGMMVSGRGERRRMQRNRRGRRGVSTSFFVLPLLVVSGWFGTPAAGAQGGREFAAPSGGAPAADSDVPGSSANTTSSPDWEQRFDREFQDLVEESDVPADVAEIVRSRISAGSGALRDLRGLPAAAAADLALEQTRRVDAALRRGARSNQAATAAVQDLRRESRRLAEQIQTRREGEGPAQEGGSQRGADQEAGDGPGRSAEARESRGSASGRPGGLPGRPTSRGPGADLPGMGPDRGRFGNRALEQLERRGGPQAPARADGSPDRGSPGGPPASPPGASGQPRSDSGSPARGSPDPPSDSPPDSPGNSSGNNPPPNGKPDDTSGRRS
jgi:hypothetical protein